MTGHTSEDTVERFRRAVLRLLGIADKSKDSDEQSEPKPKPDVSDLQAGMQGIRDLQRTVGGWQG